MRGDSGAVTNSGLRLSSPFAEMDGKAGLGARSE